MGLHEGPEPTKVGGHGGDAHHRALRCGQTDTQTDRQTDRQTHPEERSVSVCPILFHAIIGQFLSTVTPCHTIGESAHISVSHFKWVLPGV